MIRVPLAASDSMKYIGGLGLTNSIVNSPSTKSHCFKLGPTLTKELTFSSNIGKHDLDTKSKQIQQWIEKKYRVQITVKKGKNAEEPENKVVSRSRYK